MVLNGRFGEINGTAIPAGVDLLSAEGLIGLQTPESTRPKLYKLGIQASEGTRFILNGVSCVIGKTGIFELDSVVQVKTLVFPNGANSDTIIDYVY